MNYRHAFHAGNFADVMKHAVLARVLEYLMRKPTPVRFIDTHAGIGRYDLGDDDARRAGEWMGGIGHPALRAPPDAVGSLLRPYLDALGPFDPAGRPVSYPGSPALAQALLRPNDRMVLYELHPDDHDRLRAAMGRDRRIKTLRLDGYVGLNASVPPVERRGLVLVDPPFEVAGEFERMHRALVKAYRKWPTGTYMLWYPLKDLRAADAFGSAVAATGIADLLQLHLHVDGRPDPAGPLAGSGLLLVNPPYTLEAEAELILPFLAEALGRSGAGSWSARRLAGS